MSAKTRGRLLPERGPLCAAMVMALMACDIPEKPKVEGNVNGSFFEELHGKRCALELVFGSYAAGIDTAVYDETIALVKKAENVSGSVVKPWGKEGEQTVCVETTVQAAADSLKEEIEAIISRAQPTKGPVTVTSGPLLEE